MNICASAERYVIAREPLPWLLYYLCLAFFLFLVAHWLDLSNASYTNATYSKKVGLFWSVSWILTFLVFYPMFVFLAIRGARSIRGVWQDAINWRLITGPDGAPKDLARLLEEWDASLKASNGVAIAFIVICIAIAGTDWYHTAAAPLMNCTLAYPDPAARFNAPIDWSTIRIVQGTCSASRLQLVILVSLLYALLVASLAFYLIYLYYSAVAFGFLAKASSRSGESRLVYRPKELMAAIAPAVENLMLCVVMGLAVCAVMQAHAAYLQSSASDTVRFLTGDVQRLATDAVALLGFGKPVEDPAGSETYLHYQRTVFSKGITVVPLVVTVLVVGIAGIFLLYDAVRNALLYTQDKMNDPAWMDRVGFDEQDRSAVAATSHISAFVAMIPGYAFVYLAVCAMLVLSVILSSFFIFVCSAVVVFMYQLVSKYLLPGRSPRPQP